MNKNRYFATDLINSLDDNTDGFRIRDYAGRQVLDTATRKAVVEVARAAKTMAVISGSFLAYQTQTVFGQEVSVTFHRDGLNFADAVFRAGRLYGNR